MMRGWELQKIKDVCTLDKNKKGNELLPYIGLEHIESNTGVFLGSKEPLEVKSSTFKFTKNHVLYGRLRPYLNKVLLPDFDGHCSSEIFPIMVGSNLLREYLYYWFINGSTVDKINATSTGARMPRANMEAVLNFDIPIPPLEEQKQVVAILDKAFAAIDQAQANIQQNIQNAQDLFQSKLNQIFSQQGSALSGVEGGGWEEKALGEVCKKITDGAHHSPKVLYPEQTKGLYPYITSKNIRNNYMDLSNVQYVDGNFHGVNYARCTPEVGDVLLTKDGANTGNITLNTLDEPFSLLSSVCLIKPKEELLPKYLKYYIQSPVGFKSITGKMTGTAIKRVILRDIKSAKIPLTTVCNQIELVKQMDSIQEDTQKIKSQYQIKLNNLEELKQSLLQKAFTGELTKNKQAA